MDPKEQLAEDSPELKHTFQDGIKYWEKRISRLSNFVRRWAPIRAHAQTEREREGVDASFRCNSLQSVRPNSKDAEVPKTGVPPNHPFIDGFPL